MVVASLVLFGLAAFGLVKSGFRTIPIGLIVLGAVGPVMALLRPDDRGRAVSTTQTPSGSREDSTLLERRWPIAGGHPRLRVWMCFGALTLSSLSFQVAFAKLAFSAETTKGLVVIASAVAFAAVGVILLPTLEPTRPSPNAVSTTRREVLALAAMLGLGCLAFSVDIVLTHINTRNTTSELVGLSGAACLSFISTLFLIALVYVLRSPAYPR